MLAFGRMLRVGVVGLSAALIALTPADARLGAEMNSREGRIAFVAHAESGYSQPYQLTVMDADGKNRRIIGPDFVTSLSWSPDGRTIALTEVGPPNIYTINVDAPRRERRIRRIIRNGLFPVWSPNGRSIAFIRGHDIWVFNLTDRRQRRILRDGSPDSWSPDGRKLAVERDDDVWVLDLAQKTARRLLRNAGDARWSPDGRKLAVERDDDVWVLDLAQKRARRLLRNAGDARWSPDGRQIAFDRCRPDDECFIYVVRSDGTKRRRLFRGTGAVWSPNGQELAFLRSSNGSTNAILRARLDGSDRRVLAAAPSDYPDWAPPPR